MPEAALSAPKEKRLTGRQWFESGRHAVVIYFPLILPCSHIDQFCTKQKPICTIKYVLVSCCKHNTNENYWLITLLRQKNCSIFFLTHLMADLQRINNKIGEFFSPPQKGAAPATEGSDEEDVEDIDFDDDDFEGDSLSS